MAPLYPSFTPTYHHDQYPAIDPTQASLDCSNKIVLITGGGRGIGQAIAIAFAQAHAKGIALLGRTRSTLEDTATKIQEASGGKTDVFVVTADITAKDQVKSAFESAIDHFRGTVPDVLVNNAGAMFGIGRISEVDIDEVMAAFDINVRGPLTVLQTFVQASKKRSPDSPRTVINLPSGAAHLPYTSGAGAYGISKLANSKILEYIHHENPSWNAFNMQPGVVATDLAKQAGRVAPDSPRLPAGFAVWLAASPDARKLNGKFIWANWDIDEVLGRIDEIQKRDLLTLTLKGWAEDVNADELKKIAESARGEANRKK